MGQNPAVATLTSLHSTSFWRKLQNELNHFFIKKKKMLIIQPGMENNANIFPISKISDPEGKKTTVEGSRNICFGSKGKSRNKKAEISL